MVPCGHCKMGNCFRDGRLFPRARILGRSRCERKRPLIEAKKSLKPYFGALMEKEPSRRVWDALLV